MSAPMVVTHTHRSFARPTLRTITVVALVVNALFFVPDLFSSGPNGLNLGHMIPALVVAAIVASRFRWTPALGALFSGLMLVDGSMFLTDLLTQPDTTATFGLAASFFASAVVGLIVGIAATVQHYRAPRSRSFVNPPAPRWVYPALLALATLVLGGILTTAIQPHGLSTGFSPETLATLPVLTAKDHLFDQPEIKARVGETVALRLDNADTSTHYLDIDEFNVHTIIPAGESNVALFKPTQPGRYTFYCHPHADKAARTGMVGTLIVEP
jgi:FtsP/CotA-like multicopper oxidase with cupredoxin domain